MRRLALALLVVSAILVTVNCSSGVCGSDVVTVIPEEEQAIFPPAVVDAVDQHIVAIAVYFELPEMEAKRIKANKDRAVIFKSLQDEWKLPLWLKAREGYEYVVFIGAGTLLKDNYVITVAHLFTDSDPAIQNAPMVIWLMLKGLDRAIPAELIVKTAVTTGDDFWQDYALLRAKEDIGRPGIPVAKTQPYKGSPVIHAGTVHGSAFFLRFGFVTTFHQFFRSSSDGSLHLSQWTDFPLVCVYPGGPGDSGGGIYNTKGELVDIMYCGIKIAAEEYIFSNGLAKLREFITLAGYEWLLE